MAQLTVVEAASLSGLPPEAIRALIRAGRLPARSVPLPGGAAFLIDSADLAPFISRGNTAPAVATPATSCRRARLEAALAGLQAALVRSRLGSGGESAPMDEPAAMSFSLPPGRRALGLTEAELDPLVARVNRLLGSARNGASLPAARPAEPPPRSAPAES